MTPTMLDAAVRLAQAGLCVFPLLPRDKRPAVDHWPDVATNDPEQVERLWTRDYNIGAPMGANGLVGIDFDTRDGFAALKDRLTPTITSITPRGVHLLYRAPAGVELTNSAGKLAEHVDVRAGNGYLVLPSSVHPSGVAYRWAAPQHPLADLPRWVVDVLAPKRPERPAEPIRLAGASGHTRYATVALEREVQAVLDAVPGTRNCTLNAAAFSLGQLVGAGLLERSLVVTALRQAGEAIGLGEAETDRTIRSGLSKGIANPRRVAA